MTTTLICLLVVAAIVIVWFLLADEIEFEKRNWSDFHCRYCGRSIKPTNNGVCDECFTDWMKSHTNKPTR